VNTAITPITATATTTATASGHCHIPIIIIRFPLNTLVATVVAIVSIVVFPEAQRIKHASGDSAHDWGAHGVAQLVVGPLPTLNPVGGEGKPDGKPHQRSALGWGVEAGPDRAMRIRAEHKLRAKGKPAVWVSRGVWWLSWIEIVEWCIVVR
jgi:hypothetical protein